MATISVLVLAFVTTVGGFEDSCISTSATATDTSKGCCFSDGLLDSPHPNILLPSISEHRTGIAHSAAAAVCQPNHALSTCYLFNLGFFHRQIIRYRNNPSVIPFYGNEITFWLM